jgi:short-subunit dehydrogenase involved in D-alanine esterification of teichoic acids
MENEELLNRIQELEDENEELRSKIIDLTFERKYNKQPELIEFLREIYSSLNIELKGSKLTKKEVLFSLKKYIEEFSRDNKIRL